MKAEAKKQTKKLSWKMWVLIGALAIVIAYSAYAVMDNIADINRLKAQSVEYQTQYEQQVDDNEKIKAILNSDSKDEYIEQKAREKGYVKSGETVFYDISSSK